jgi:5-methylcytosine-specific restriction endonuclease McrA
MRYLVLKRDGDLCQACLVKPATEVHHRNYSQEFGQEFMFDLIAVCHECHEKITNDVGKRQREP